MGGGALNLAYLENSPAPFPTCKFTQLESSFRACKIAQPELLLCSHPEQYSFRALSGGALALATPYIGTATADEPLRVGMVLAKQGAFAQQGADLFFHRVDVEGNAYDALQEGQTVNYEIGTDERRGTPKATRVAAS